MDLPEAVHEGHSNALGRISLSLHRQVDRGCHDLGGAQDLRTLGAGLDQTLPLHRAALRPLLGRQGHCCLHGMRPDVLAARWILTNGRGHKVTQLPGTIDQSAQGLYLLRLTHRRPRPGVDRTQQRGERAHGGHHFAVSFLDAFFAISLLRQLSQALLDRPETITS